jgi:hypothetical protein
MKTYGNLILMTVICIVIFWVFMALRPASAQDARRLPDGTWQMQNYGRNHGVLSGPGMPKCNPHVSDECRRLYPSLLNKVPPPEAKMAR